MAHMLRRFNSLRIPISRCNLPRNGYATHASAFKVDAIQSQFPEGKELSGFKVQSIQEIPELQLTAIQLEHLKTNARHVHIARDDPNNVFCIGFRTVPRDNTGIPHILEHNVLCGSSKFPCRDPFFKMLNRSLSTFMNAMTGSDCTFYPFSTQHPVDFKNLLSVYLDATLRPNLREVDFMQEGWRLEPQDLKDKTSPLVFKGVVFNEMKGVFADPQQIYACQLQNNLVPSHTYGCISGGDPVNIPDLSWKGMREFHAKYYHPSNSFIFTYGNFPLEDHLAYIDTNYLAQYEKLDIDSFIPPENRWSQPRNKHVTCCSDPMLPLEKQSNLSVSFLLAGVEDHWENFVLSVIAQLLVSGPNAPFYKSLIEPGLGTSFTSTTGYDGDMVDSAFSVGLQGVDMQAKDKIVSVIEETFKESAETGFTQERIESVLHQTELSLKHQRSSFGLNLCMSLVSTLNAKANALETLSIHKMIHKLRMELKENPKYLQEYINKYFLQNQHKLVLSMSPDPSYESERKLAEENLLASKVSALSGSDKSRIIDLCSQLEREQETEPDVSCLPTLHVSDISRSIPGVKLHRVGLSGGSSFTSIEQPTNQVTYFNAILNTTHLPERLQPLVPLFAEVLNQMGAGNLDFRQLEQQSSNVSGGLGSCTHVSTHPVDPTQYESGILLASHCLAEKFTPMMDLWAKIFNELRMDDYNRFSTLIKMTAAEHANTLVHRGHIYAMTSARSTTSFIGRLIENWEGLTYLTFLQDKSNLEDYNQLISDLKEIASLVFQKENMRMALTTSPSNTEQNTKELDLFVKQLNGSVTGDVSMAHVPSGHISIGEEIHHVFDLPVNFSSKAFPSVPFTHEDYGPLKILARLMFKFLHREIREKGGAYGGGARSGDSAFQFYSYRDPNSTRTLQTFDDSVDWVLEGNPSEQDLSEAKLGVFQDVDAPVAPGSRGMREFSGHVTDAMLAAYRISILDADMNRVREVALKYLKSETNFGATLIGPQNEFTSSDSSWKKVNH